MCNCSENKHNIENLIRSNFPLIGRPKYVTQKDYHLQKFMNTSNYYEALRIIGSNYRPSSAMIEKYTSNDNASFAYDLIFKTNTNIKHLVVMGSANSNYYSSFMVDSSGMVSSFSAHGGGEPLAIANVGQTFGDFFTCWNAVITIGVDSLVVATASFNVRFCCGVGGCGILLHPFNVTLRVNMIIRNYGEVQAAYEKTFPNSAPVSSMVIYNDYNLKLHSDKSVLILLKGKYKIDADGNTTLSVMKVRT